MTYYKLVPSGQSPIVANEIIVERDDLTGEVTGSISAIESRELSEDAFNKAVEIAGRIGYKVVEAPAPESAQESQPAGDAQGAVVRQGEGGAEIDQVATEGQAAQQGSDVAGGSAPAGGGPSTFGGGFTTS